MSRQIKFSLFCIISVALSKMANAQNYQDEWKRLDSTVHSGIIEFKIILLSKSFLKNPTAIDIETLEARFSAEDFEVFRFCSEFLDTEQLPYETPWDEITLSFNDAASRQDRNQPYRDEEHKSHSVLLYTKDSESVIHKRLSGRKQVQIVSGSFPPEMYRLDDIVFHPHMDSIKDFGIEPSEYRSNTVRLTFQSSARENIAEIDRDTGFVYRYAAHFHSGQLAELILQEAPVSIDGYLLPNRRLDLTVSSEGVRGLRLVQLDQACLNCDPGDVFDLTAEPGVPIFDHRSNDGSRTIVTPHKPLKLSELTSNTVTDPPPSQKWRFVIILAVNGVVFVLIMMIIVRERKRRRPEDSHLKSDQ
jgi:hypothetical protein